MNKKTDDKSDSQKRERKPATDGASSITAETRVKDFLPQGLLDDIRTLQAIVERLDKYEEEKKAQEEMWEVFYRNASRARENIDMAIYDLSEIAGKELDYKIMNR